MHTEEAHPEPHNWVMLEKELRADEGCFCGDNFSAAALAERYYSNMAGVVFHRHGNPVAYAGLWDTAFPRTYELGKLWVRKCYRGIESTRFLGAAVIPGKGVLLHQLSHAVLGRCNSIIRGNGPGLGFNAHLFTRVPAVAEYMKFFGWQVAESAGQANRKALLRGLTAQELEARDPYCNDPCFWCYAINHDPHQSVRHLYDE